MPIIIIPFEDPYGLARPSGLRFAQINVPVLSQSIMTE
ncbi:hypothetical protein SAMCFNEI73_Ch2484 [Sinorhizobium americanum]|uniref:Uncharacterized protein n=1 Tax=Sinorhizobium americanum TaxID=194963 RepID=A0A1L3LNT8_9HYPH|nr:hypothetical protein SAMCFNEI73_Ch2484 [Sinorhizobium americanum]